MTIPQHITDLARMIELDGRLFINGKRCEATDASTSEKVNPATGEAIGMVAEGTARDVDLAVKAAREAFPTWAARGKAARRRVLLSLAALIEEHTAELAMMETLDMGKPFREASSIDIPGAAAVFRFYAEAIEKHVDSIPVTPPGSTALVTREPLGVVGAIIPWNYPLEIAAWKLAPALAAGNCVVVKPSEESPHSVLRLADLAAQAGIPDGVLNVVTGSGETVGRAIARHPGVDMVAFTGSTETAKLLQIYAGESNMKRLALEAGGKSSNIIFADADLAQAAQKAAFGAFYNQGEVCSANSRIFVEEQVAEEFLSLLAEASQAYYPGNPLDPECGTGSMVSHAHTDSVMEAIASAKDSGNVVLGGHRLTITGSDAYIEPTIVTDVPADHILHTKEIFGPVVVVTPFTGEDEVIARANETPYGLAASVWTQDLSRAMRVAHALTAGTVSVNTVDALGLTTPFGGFKQSGFGRDLSVAALNNYTDLKTTWLQWG